MLFVAALLASAGAGAFMLNSLQRQLIYFPQRASDAELLRVAPALGLLPWTAASGERIGWMRATATADVPALLVFHGNAGYALHRGYFADGFANWHAYLFEYPGYGARAGEPSQATIEQAALEALDQLTRAHAGPVYLLGESLGSGVACHLAAERPHRIAGLVLVTPFTRLQDVAEHHYPWAAAVPWLLSERWDCLAGLAEYRGPVAFLLAGQDEIIPTRLGQQLHDAYRGAKFLYVDPAAGHNSIDYDPRLRFWGEIAAFLGR